MFDIGWSELLLIGIVALFVIGPKQLPDALRQAGRWMRSARKVAGEFQHHVNDMMREAELEDVKKGIQQARSFTIRGQIEKAIDPKGDINRDLRAAFDPPAKPAATAKPPTPPVGPLAPIARPPLPVAGQNAAAPAAPQAAAPATPAVAATPAAPAPTPAAPPPPPKLKSPSAAAALSARPAPARAPAAEPVTQTEPPAPALPPAAE